MTEKWRAMFSVRREFADFARLASALGWMHRALEVHARAVWMHANVSPSDERTRAWDADPQCADDRACWDGAA